MDAAPGASLIFERALQIHSGPSYHSPPGRARHVGLCRAEHPRARPFAHCYDRRLSALRPAQSSTEVPAPDGAASDASRVIGLITVGDRTRTIGGLALVLVVALAIILMQPLGAPWWYHADADGTYVANSYELAAGHHTWYLDHPGMPLQDLMAITFEARYVGQKLFGSATPKDQYLNQQVLNLDDSRPYFRSFAAVFYLLGALIAFWVVRATLKSTLWGIGAGLLWIGAPGLVEMSIQYRADVPLCALVLLVGFLIVRAAERRDAWLYVLATFALGFTITVKIHAAALVAPLALAVAVRPPLGPWRDALVIRTRNVAVRLRIPLALAASAWIVLIVIFNRSRLPSPFGDWRYPNGTHTNADIRRLVLEILVVLIGYTALALVARRIRSRIVRRLFDPFVAVLLWSLVVGVVLPGTLVIEDGLAMLVSIHDGLTGGGVNTSVYVTPFAHAWNNLVHWPLQQFLVLFGLAAVAVVVGVRRGELGPALWFTAAAAAALFAAARLGTRHYWAPAYVLSVPPALWLCRQLRLVGAVGAAGLVLYSSCLRSYTRDGADQAHQQKLGLHRCGTRQPTGFSSLRKLHSRHRMCASRGRSLPRPRPAMG